MNMTTETGAGPTRRLAAFLAGLGNEDLPETAYDAAKTMVLDLIGCGLGAVTTEEARIASEVFADMGGTPEASVFGRFMRLSAANAAYLNGLLAHILEMDDTHRNSITHVGAAVIPAALAVAERENCSGRTFLAAVIIGYEACLRIANAVQPSHWRRGYLSMGTCGTFGAAAAAGHILGCNGDQLADAFGLSGITAAGINSSIYGEGDMGKRLVPGHAAQAGVIAMQLAMKGFTGSRNVLEQPKGFCSTMADEYDLEAITRDFARQWEVEATSLKPYSCCRYNHAAIDGVLDILDETGLGAADIKTITVHTFGIAVHNRPHRARPETLFDARMSIPFSLAVAVDKRAVSDDDFSEDLIHRPDLQEFATRVIVEEDPAASAVFPREWPCEVIVETAGGISHRRQIAFPKGEPEAAMTPGEVEAKFFGLARRALPEARVDEIIDALGDLGDAPEFRSFARLLAKCD